MFIKEPARTWSQSREAEKMTFAEYKNFPDDLYILPLHGQRIGLSAEDVQRVRIEIQRKLHGTAVVRKQEVLPLAHCTAAKDRVDDMRSLLNGEVRQLLQRHLEAVVPELFWSLHVTAPCKSAKCSRGDSRPFFHGPVGPEELTVVCVCVAKDKELLSQTLENIFGEVKGLRLQSRAFNCNSEADAEALKGHLDDLQLKRVQDEARVALVPDMDGTRWHIHGWRPERLNDAESRLSDLLVGCGKTAELPLNGLALLGPENSRMQQFFLGRGLLGPSPLAVELQGFLHLWSWKWEPDASTVPVVRGIRPQDLEKFQAETSQKLLSLEKRLLVHQVPLPRPVHRAIAKHADVEKSFQQMASGSGQHTSWDLTTSVSAGSTKGLQCAYEDPSGCQLEIRLLDIAKFEAAALVVPSNSLLKPQAGSARSLERAGGQVLREAMEERVRSGGMLRDMDVVRLPEKGDLKCNAVYCVVCPVFPSTGTDEDRSFQTGVLREAYYCVITQAAMDGYDTLALPLMGAGSFNWPRPVAAEQLLKAWVRAAKAKQCPQAVVLCEVSEECAAAVIAAAGDLVQAGEFQCTQEPPPVLSKLALKKEPQKVSWQFLVREERAWKEYSADDARVLEDEYLRDPKGKFPLVVHTSDTKKRDSFGLPTYQIDLENMQQTNQTSGIARPMRRIVLVEEASLDGQEGDEGDVEEEAPEEKGPEEADQVSQSLRLITFVPGTEPIDRKTVMASLEALSRQMLDRAEKELICESLDELEKEDLDALKAQIDAIAKANFVEVQKDDSGQARLYGLMEDIRSARKDIISEFLKETRKRRAAAQDAEVLPRWMPKRGAFGAAAPELLEVNRSEPEVIKAVELFERTSRGKKVVNIQRIYNALLWDKVSSRRRLLKKKLGYDLQEDVHERYLFHGTGRTDPKIIVCDEDGLDMKYSNPGMWGNGIYFAEEAWYSCQSTYAHMIPGTNRGQLFICKVLLGEYVLLPPTRDLKKPPQKASSAAMHAYDSVRGRHPQGGGVDVFIVYDNGLAYPEFLVDFE